jgi:U3 small nucleolar RNA-associated protein 14
MVLFLSVVDASDADDEGSSSEAEEPAVDLYNEGSSSDKAAVDLSDERSSSEESAVELFDEGGPSCEEMLLNNILPPCKHHP